MAQLWLALVSPSELRIKYYETMAADQGQQACVRLRTDLRFPEGHMTTPDYARVAAHYALLALALRDTEE